MDLFSCNSGSNRAFNFKSAFMLGARPILKLLTRLPSELYSPRPRDPITVENLVIDTICYWK